MKSKRIHADVAFTIVAALLAITLASTLPQTSGTPAAGRRGAVWPSELLARTYVRGGFAYTVEGMISSTPKGPYIGMDQSRVPPAPPDQTVGKFVKFLQAHLPDFAVGRYSYARRVIYLVNRPLLTWRHDPLDQKLSFHGTMSFDRLESHVLSKLVPTVHFYNEGPPGIGSGSGSGVVMVPEPKQFKVPMHFDIKAMTLRRFLTTGIRYVRGPAGTGQQSWDAHVSGPQLWSADVYCGKNGKPTGRVNIFIMANPVPQPAGAHAGAKRK